MKRTFVLFAIALLTMIGGATDSVAADNAPVLSRIVESGTFKVGMSGNQPPFSVISKSGSLIGYEVDLANLLADAMGVEVEFVQKPFGELLPALEKGEIDVIAAGMAIAYGVFASVVCWAVALITRRGAKSTGSPLVGARRTRWRR